MFIPSLLLAVVFIITQNRMASAGDTGSPELTAEICQKENSLRKYYYRNNKLVGCTLINDLHGAGTLYELISKNRQNL